MFLHGWDEGGGVEVASKVVGVGGGGVIRGV